DSYEAGVGAQASGQQSTAVGVDAEATALDSTAIGYKANAKSVSTAIGADAQATGSFSTATGASAKASDYSTALGYLAETSADSSTAIGTWAKAYYSNSVAFGNQSTTTSKDQVSIGRYDSTKVGTSDPWIDTRTIVGLKSSISSDAGKQGTTFTDKLNAAAADDTAKYAAVNVSDLKSAMEAAGGTTYTSTDNIDVDNIKKTISLKDNIQLTSAGSIDIGDNTKISDGKLMVAGTSIDKNGVKVGTNTTLADGSLTIGSSTLTSSALSVGTSSLTTSALKVGGAEYINASGVNANSNKITNVAAGTSATDAAAVGQTVSKITSGTSNVKVEESTAGDGSKEYKISVDGGGSGGKIYTAGKNIKLTGTDETVINLDDTVKLAENGSISVGDKTYIDANGVNANSKKITNVAAGTEDTDAASYGQLKAQKEASEKYTDDKTAEAKDYTDTKAAEAKDYTDTKAAEAKD
ncbi:MAG: hypothetical protein HUJ86_01860, partial [Synergistes sp.]|nr:hypothetical protein [Synergistes sp.]